jgi:hypothetical protein
LSDRFACDYASSNLHQIIGNILMEVCHRLMRYGIETRDQVKTGKLPEFAWGPEAEALYQRWTNYPDFERFEREILASPKYSGETNAR